MSVCVGRVLGTPDIGWLQEALGGPQELPKFYCLNKNFKVMKLYC